MTTTELLHALAPLLNGEVLGNIRHQSEFIQLHALRARLTLSHSWRSGSKYTCHIYDDEGQSIHGSPSASFDPTRSPVSIAADITCRIITEARKPLTAHYIGKQAREAADIKHRARLSQLTDILGPLDYCQHSHAFGWRQLHTRSDTDLTGSAYRGIHRAEIEVASFDCLLMIARLIAEDKRIHAPKTEP